MPKCFECGEPGADTKCAAGKHWFHSGGQCEEGHVPWCLEQQQEFRDKESEQVETAMETTFGLERDLQQALRANLQQLEMGLLIADSGREQRVPSGRIDMLAKDTEGASVVIELKAGTADRDAVGQILSYMGDLQAEGHPKVRGMVIAGYFTPRAVAAARAANISLRKYVFNFSFEQVVQPI